jgi:hypothetical protein
MFLQLVGLRDRDTPVHRLQAQEGAYGRKLARELRKSDRAMRLVGRVQQRTAKAADLHIKHGKPYHLLDPEVEVLFAKK